MATAGQIRAARALIGWTQGQVAAASGLSVPTVKRVEGESATRASVAAASAIRTALEAAGVVFLDPNGGGPGVRLREAQNDGR